MRLIRRLGSGLALLLIAGCMSVHSSHVTACHFEAPAAQANDEFPAGPPIQQTAARLPDPPPLANPNGDVPLSQPKTMATPEEPGVAMVTRSDACCDSSCGSCHRCISIGCWLPCVDLSRITMSLSGLGNCAGRVYDFATYRPLCQSVPKTCCPDCDCHPPLYWYFQPSKYNQPLQPAPCCDHGWQWYLFPWRRSCEDCCSACGPRIPPRVPVACPPRQACALARVARPAPTACCDDCWRPVGSRIAAHLPAVGCTASGCGGGVPACQTPKPKLDGLPILAPTMFRKYAPCDESDGGNMMSPVPGTSVPADKLPINQPKRPPEAKIIDTGWQR